MSEKVTGRLESDIYRGGEAEREREKEKEIREKEGERKRGGGGGSRTENIENGRKMRA